MEVYILDGLYRRVQVVDTFESLIWTERFSAYGDFELLLHSNSANRQKFLTGTNLAINETYGVMSVETVEDATDADGRQVLKIKGRSLEAILEERVARNSLTNLTIEPKWVITGTPAEIARKLFHDVCVLGKLDPGDIIPLLSEGSSIFPEDTIDEPSEIITVEIDLMTIYSAIKSLADSYGFGFRLIRNLDAGQLYFDVYMGSDRTSQQSDVPAIVFSEGLDNLQNTTALQSIALYKNVAYVISPVGYEIVYPLDVDPDIQGFQRRVMFIKADDIEDSDLSVASDKMIQRGREELAKHRSLLAFDGEINQNSQYKFGVDYFLGDRVEMRDSDGTGNIMQVTEQIFVSDSQGDRSYPTLTLNAFITAGSWSSWEFSTKTWSEFGDETWEDMAGGPDPKAKWHTVLDKYATWQALLDAHATWQDVIDS